MTVKKTSTPGTGSKNIFNSIETISDPQQLIASFFNSPTVGFAVCDDRFRYRTINDTLARLHGLPREAHLGKTLRNILGDSAEEVEPVLRRVLATAEPVINVELDCQFRTRTEVGHWIANYFPIKDRAGRVKQIAALVVEVTNEKKLEQSLHALTGKLLRAQDEEQRRIARDLHDCINQYHVALKMNLLRLRRSGPQSTKSSHLLGECIELLERCMAETRTISYLLHPPLLDEMGFACATRWYVKGFAQRSGIQVNLNLSCELERLPAAIEIALFRVLQEALTNVYRHAHTPLLDVHVERTPAEIVLQVRDYGRGIPGERLRQLQGNTGAGGVGIASMRERIHEVGGVLQIESNHHGTTVRAEIPITSVGQECSGDLLANAVSA